MIDEEHKSHMQPWYLSLSELYAALLLHSNNL